MANRVTNKAIEEAHKLMRETHAACVSVAGMQEMVIEKPSDAHDPEKLEKYRAIGIALVYLREIREKAAHDYEQLCLRADAERGVLP